MAQVQRTIPLHLPAAAAPSQRDTVGAPELSLETSRLPTSKLTVSPTQRGVRTALELREAWPETPCLKRGEADRRPKKMKPSAQAGKSAVGTTHRQAD